MAENNIMKQLLKEWNEFLNEISFDDAKKVLDSNRTRKIIKGFAYDFLSNDNIDINSSEGQKAIESFLHNFKINILDYIPRDIEDPEKGHSEKGEALLWLITLSRNNDEVKRVFILGQHQQMSNIANNIELFFQYKRQYENALNKKSIQDIESPAELKAIVDDARPKIAKYEKEFGKGDTTKNRHIVKKIIEGTILLKGEWKNVNVPKKSQLEVIHNSDGWALAEIHNKYAANYFGEVENCTADWCTAALSLDYFNTYYAPGDPLFVFLGEKTGEKYQFHYGTEQFKNKDDLNISEIDKEMGTNVANTLHKMLFATSAGEKYPVVAKYKNTVLANDPETDTEELRKLYDEGIFNTDLAKNPSTPADILLKFAESKHAPIRRFVASNKGAPPEALIKLAEDLFLMVRTAVAENTSTPVDVLKKMKDDNHSDISSLAAQVLEDRESKQQGELSESIINLWQKIIN